LIVAHIIKAFSSPI